MVTFVSKGDFRKTIKFLNGAKSFSPRSILEKYGELGVRALAENTPKDTGHTAECWSYKINKEPNGYSIVWSNSNVSDGVPIAILLRFGHGTGTGGYVQGRDFITPAIRSLFDNFADSLWKELMNK